MGCHTLHIFTKTILWVLLLNILISLLTFQFAFYFFLFLLITESYISKYPTRIIGLSLFLIVSIFFYAFWGYVLIRILIRIIGIIFITLELFLSSINMPSNLLCLLLIELNTLFFLFVINICMSYPSPSFIFNVYKFIIFLLYFEYHLWYIVGFLIHSDFFLLLRALTTFISIYLYLFHISFYSIISIFYDDLSLFFLYICEMLWNIYIFKLHHFLFSCLTVVYSFVILSFSTLEKDMHFSDYQSHTDWHLFSDNARHPGTLSPSAYLYATAKI